MFLSRQQFKESLDALSFIDGANKKIPENKQIAIGFAKEIFDNFDKLGPEDQAAILEMLLKDMKIGALSPN